MTSYYPKAVRLLQEGIKGGTMTDRTDYVASMTDHERIAALSRLAVVHPEVFDELREDIERQRRIREERRAFRASLRPGGGTSAATREGTD